MTYTRLAAILAVAVATVACADSTAPRSGNTELATPTFDVVFKGTLCPAPFGDPHPYKDTDPASRAVDNNANGLICSMELVNAEAETRLVFTDDHPNPIHVGKCHKDMELVDAPKDAATGAWDAADENQNLKKCKGKKKKKVNGVDVVEDVFGDDNLKDEGTSTTTSTAP